MFKHTTVQCFFALLALCAVLFLTSCASTTTAYIEGYEENPSNYEVTSLVWQNPLLGKHFVSWNGYTMERTRGYGAGFEVAGFESIKSGASYKLLRGETELYPVHVIYKEKGFPLPSLFHESVTLSDSSVIFTTGNPSVNIPLEDKDIILQDSSTVPYVTVEKLHSSLQNGKVYKMWGNVTTGVRVLVKGEEYAVVDYYAKDPRVLVNKTFSFVLDQNQQDYLASVVMGMYAYYKLLEQDGETSGQTLKIVN